MLSRKQIDERLAAKLPGTERRVATGREREALETAQKLYGLLEEADVLLAECGVRRERELSWDKLVADTEGKELK